MCGHPSVHGAKCQNCGEPLSGPYCAKCGQRDIDFKRSFWHIVEEALEGGLHFDGKFFRSARYIFTRPGFLTNEFVAGRRARYTQPVRFYIFASFLFFAFSVVTSLHVTPAERAAEKAESRDARAAAGDLAGAGKDPAGSKAAPEPGPPAGFHVTVTPQGATTPSWLDDPLQIRFDSKDRVGLKDLRIEFFHLLPTMLFVCLPLLALVLQMAYLRSGRLYIEHLIFALHVQALAFLSFIVLKTGAWLGSLSGPGVETAAGDVVMLGMLYLIFRAFRTVYGQGRLKTAFKMVLVGAAYGLILIFAFAAVGRISVYLVSRNA
jgi:hypothetical protein